MESQTIIKPKKRYGIQSEEMIWILCFLFTYTILIAVANYFFGKDGIIGMLFVGSAILLIVRELTSYTYYEVIEYGNQKK